MAVISQNISSYIWGTLEDQVFYEVSSSGSIPKWTIASDSTWVTKSVSEYGIPHNCILEINIENADEGQERYVGVREVDSALDRRIQLHESEGYGYVTPQGRGKDQLQMPVNVSWSGTIECYAELATHANFYILGYWVSGVYVEKHQLLSSVSSPSTWEDVSISGYGVVSGEVADIVIANTDSSAQRECGVRQNGSTIERLFDLHKAELGQGLECVTMSVLVGESGIFERYAEDVGDVQFWLIGHWTTRPLPDYTEIFYELGENFDNDGAWETKNLFDIFYPFPIGSVGEFIMHNENTGWCIPLGIRDIDSDADRVITMGEAEGDGTDAVRVHTTIKEPRWVQTSCSGGTLSPYGWALTAYWSRPSVKTTKILSLSIFGQSGLPAGFRTDKIYWTETNSTNDNIQVIDPDGSNRQVILSYSADASGVNNPYGIDIDYIAGKVYWINANTLTIMRCNLDGSNVEDMLEDFIVLGAGKALCLHPEIGKMFWTCTSTDKIYVCNLEIPSGETYKDRTDVSPIVSGLNNPWGLALDKINNYLYWATSTDHNIERVTTSGTDRRLIYQGANPLYAIGVDPYRGWIFWVDVTNDEMYRANAEDGSVITTITDVGVSTVFNLRLDFDAKKIYWTDQVTDKVYGMSYDGSYQEILASRDLPDFPIYNPVGIGLAQTRVATDNLDLVLQGPYGQTGELDLFLKVAWEISASGTLHQFGPIQATSGLDLYLENFQDIQQSGTMFLKTIEPYASGIDLFLQVPEPQASGISLYTTALGPPENLELYITASVSGTPYSGVIDRITIDPSGDNHTHERLLATSGFYNPREIVIDPYYRYMYWCEFGDDLPPTSGGTGAIWRAHLTGEFQEKLISTSGETQSPVGIAIDKGNDRLHWTDYENCTIMSSDLDGDWIETVVESGKDPGPTPSGMIDPKGLEISTIDDKAYYIGDDTLIRGDMPDIDEEDRESLQALTYADHFALDIWNGKVYWAYQRTGRIYRSNLDGSNKQTLKSGLGTPRDIEIDYRNDKVYWVDSETGKVERCDLNGSNYETIYTFNPTEPVGITLNYPALGIVPLNSNISLHLLGPSGASSGISLYLENWGASGVFSAFMEVPGGPGYADLDLHMVGSASGESLFYSYLDLCTAGKESHNYYTTHPLYMQVPSGWAVDSASWSLFLDSDTLTRSSIDLVTYGHASGEQQRGPTWINIMPLLIANIGTHTGWYPHYDSRFLFMRVRDGAWNDISLYTSGERIPTAYSGDCTLATSGHDVPTQVALLYIFGISGTIDNGPSGLFLHTYCDHADQFDNLQLYTHGY